MNKDQTACVTLLLPDGIELHGETRAQQVFYYKDVEKSNA